MRLALQVVNRPQANVLAMVLGNLAGKAGSVEVIVEATKPGGFDRGWLRNAVYEPLDEAGIDFEE